MILKPALILILIAQFFGTGLIAGQSAKVLGSWRIEVTFGNGEARFFQFEAEESGKASLRLLDPRMGSSGPAGSSAAKWIQTDDGTVTFSGPVEFPLGNVGIDPGTLVLKGKSGPEGSISGEATFFLLSQDPNDPRVKPAKNGSFKAIRSANAHSPISPAP